jgi:hypothetical protein
MVKSNTTAANPSLQTPAKISQKDQKMLSPCSNECRAFVLLDDVGCDGTWAVKCHGWMYLTDMRPRSKLLSLDREDCSRCAIAKDFVPRPARPQDLQEICSKFQIAKDAKDAGILPADLYPWSSRESFIVDLGSAETFPSTSLSKTPRSSPATHWWKWWKEAFKKLLKAC